MANTNKFAPPVSAPPDRPPSTITQNDQRAINQPFGAIPAVMSKIGRPDFHTIPVTSSGSRKNGRR